MHVQCDDDVNKIVVDPKLCDVSCGAQSDEKSSRHLAFRQILRRNHNIPVAISQVGNNFWLEVAVQGGQKGHSRGYILERGQGTK
jgi:hypothetical protein